MKRRSKLALSACLIALSLPMAAQANDALLGALVGAGAGALIGQALGGRDGAIAGGVVGAVAGALWFVCDAFRYCGQALLID